MLKGILRAGVIAATIGLAAAVPVTAGAADRSSGTFFVLKAPGTARAHHRFDVQPEGIDKRARHPWFCLQWREGTHGTWHSYCPPQHIFFDPDGFGTLVTPVEFDKPGTYQLRAVLETVRNHRLVPLDYSNTDTIRVTR
ncbi:hypothetical protein [Streptacidiphilus jiangxiensis]|uniref:Uncharacterized protein n=1 Tax=Streptacidiphilus jiangxiensis TaxID=235985 RepID=A0A1H7MSS5_STRJI|nr:hypothetical protein [Streptacidiphilus jiangxiensis]SEL14416.1 hypothetical protein SAMN05414137_10651 [Streptacidiphilus jiangxiensis]